jgi:pilus assembly protein CpaF
VVTTELFGPGPDGRATPRHLPERLTGQLLRAGYDPRELVPHLTPSQVTWHTPGRLG